MPEASRVRMFTWTLKLLDQKYRGYRKVSILKKGPSNSHCPTYRKDVIQTHTKGRKVSDLSER